MEQENIVNDISNLPPRAQRQVIDFIDFLKTRYDRSPAKKQSKRKDLFNESFIGIWKDREDMKDSGIWLRNVRKTQWCKTT